MKNEKLTIKQLNQNLKDYVFKKVKDKENNERIRIKLIDGYGNVYYFVVEK